MSHALKMQHERLEELKGQKKYTDDLLMNRINEMESWEVKEYSNLSVNYKFEISELQYHLNNL